MSLKLLFFFSLFLRFSLTTLVQYINTWYHQLEEENYFYGIHHSIYIISFKPYTNSLLPIPPFWHTHLHPPPRPLLLNEETETQRG